MSTNTAVPARVAGGRLRGLSLGLGAAAVLGVSVVAAVPASATPTNQCSQRDVTVPEWSSGITTGTYLSPGRSLTITATGSIWAGVWLTGTNGPDGWTNLAPAGFPQPNARAFSLLARVNGAWTYVGQGAKVTNTGSTTQPIQLRINDDSPGNGSGAFTAGYTTCDMSDVPASQYTVTKMIARHSGKCLDVAYASLNHAAPVVQGTCWGGDNQLWTPRPIGSGYYEIVAKHSGKCLDVAYASMAHAAPIVQGTCSGGTNQHWRFVPTRSGYYQVVARHSGKCLDVAYASTAHAAPVVQGNCVGGQNQQWRFN